MRPDIGTARTLHRSSRFASGRRPGRSWAVLLGLFLVGCAPGDDRGTVEREGEAGINGPMGSVEVTDDAGRVWEFDSPPRRVISLVPSATGIIRALGLQDRLVGRTDYDRGSALASLPSVGGGLEPSLERLIGLEPDLVIRFEGPTDRATPDALDRMGTPHLAIRPDTIGDIHRIIEMVSVVMGVSDRGAALRARITGELEEVRESVEGLASPRVVFVLGGDPPWVAGAGTFLHELIEVVGGENVFGDTGPLYAPMSVEEVIGRDPELLLATEGARIPPSLGHLPVRRVPEEIQSPGAGVGQSAWTLARILHPDLSSPPEPLPPDGGSRP